jgi:hypothetical protein
MIEPDAFPELPSPASPIIPRQVVLPWRTAGASPYDRKTFAAMPLGRFASALKQAGVLDNRAVDLPGASVVLPFGVRLFEGFRAIVRQEYLACGLEEFEYPLAAPRETFAPTASLFPLDDMLLHLASDTELAESTARASLCPTGEAIIYTHWRRMIRTVNDLPIQMFRQARYFRPLRSKGAGPSILRGMEAADIFEFHCAYATEKACRAALDRFGAMLRRLAARLHLPVLWCTRPPWTNRRQVSEWTIGGDVPLPIGSTVQVSCLYNQGQRFSRPYDVGFKSGGVRTHTRHITGFSSRRMPIVHLMLGVDERGMLFLHPDLAPDQVVLLFTQGAKDDSSLIDQLIGKFAASGLRTRLERPSRTSELNRLLRDSVTRGVPVLLLIQGRRHDGDRIKLVARRSDTGEEASLQLTSAAALVDTAKELIAAIGECFDARIQHLVASRCLETNDLVTLRGVLDARRVAICPLASIESTVQEVASWRTGEVLGFTKTAEARPCIITGTLTNARAFVSPRL